MSVDTCMYMYPTYVQNMYMYYIHVYVSSLPEMRLVLSNPIYLLLHNGKLPDAFPVQAEVHPAIDTNNEE